MFERGVGSLIFRLAKAGVLCKEEAQNGNLKQNYAFQLLKCIFEHILSQAEDIQIPEFMSVVPQLLLVAAELGNLEFVIALLNYFPDAISTVDCLNNRSIFHLAVLLRHLSIFNLLHELGSTIGFLITLKDDEGNNMLHLAAKLAPPDQLNNISGAALQMQREILWYKETEKIVQPSYRDMKNREGKTPHDIFKEEHKDLMKEGEAWMKETANSCMLVATLITTVVFTAAFTVPGGNISDTGVPILLNEPFFKVFAISEGIAMFSSSTSILMFLSILTSRYGEREFLHSLPLRLMIGITSLSISIAALAVSFCTTIFLFYHHESLLQVPILLTIFFCVPIMSIILKFPLLVDIICSTYVSRFLFRSHNRLFQELPKLNQQYYLYLEPLSF